MFFHPVDAEWQTTARIALNLNENIIRHDLITQDSKLKQLLAEPCEVQSIVKDGNCYLRCISVSVSSVQDHHWLIRESFVDYMLKNGEHTLRHLHMENSKSVGVPRYSGQDARAFREVFCVAVGSFDC